MLLVVICIIYSAYVVHVAPLMHEVCTTIVVNVSYSETICREICNGVGIQRRRCNAQGKCTDDMDNACGSGWIPVYNVCYHLHQTPALPWRDAKAVCQDQGAKLISLDTTLDKVFIQQEQEISSKSWWIGFRRDQTTGRFEWESGAPWNTNITQWSADTNSLSSCVQLVRRHAPYLKQVPCANHASFVCEKCKTGYSGIDCCNVVTHKKIHIHGQRNQGGSKGQ